MERERNDWNGFLLFFFFKFMFLERYAYIYNIARCKRTITEIILKTLFDDNYIVLRMRINTCNVE